MESLPLTRCLSILYLCDNWMTKYKILSSLELEQMLDSQTPES